uniref:DNA 3'-5' helicase n=1 Tax=Pseudonaja textilis TaxID=8673 RepID=A0A670ZTK6_PSETE
MAAIVLLAGGVCDVQELVNCLRRPSAPMSRTDTLELLYCAATLLYAMRENEEYLCQFGLVVKDTGGFYAKTEKASESVRKEWKKEPSRLFYMQNEPKGFLILLHKEMIISFTSPLSFCRSYRQKLNPGSLTSYMVSFVLSNRQGQSPFIRGKTIVQTLTAFFASADATITMEHTPIWFKNNRGQIVLMEGCEKHIIVEEAKQIWSKMKSLGPTQEMAHRMTHDGYLKLWQLQKPSLSNYDAILVDEAQDCTPAVMDIVLSQTCGVILVGDPHQQIYTFRGAVNSLSNVPHSRIFYLTQSFRFGSEIAYVGATLLDVCKKVRNKILVGNNQEGEFGVEGKVARLSRNNQTVFEDAVNVTGGDSPAKIHLLGGLKAFGLDKIHDLWKLLHPEREFSQLIKDFFVKRWVEKGLAGIRDYAKKAEDKQLEIKIGIVEKYRERIPELLERISRCHVLDPKDAGKCYVHIGPGDLLVSPLCILDYILGTVHKAKGLEFDTVQVAGDFVSIPFTWPYPGRLPRTVPEAIPEDEWNLMYVAVTRAKKRLVMSRYLADILKVAKVNSSPSQCRRSSAYDHSFSKVTMVLKKPMTSKFSCTAHTCASRLIFAPFEAFFGLPEAQGKPLEVQEAEKRVFWKYRKCPFSASRGPLEAGEAVFPLPGV